MAFSVGYSKYLWRNGERDAEAVHASQLIYIIKKLSLVWS